MKTIFTYALCRFVTLDFVQIDDEKPIKQHLIDTASQKIHSLILNGRASLFDVYQYFGEIEEDESESEDMPLMATYITVSIELEPEKIHDWKNNKIEIEEKVLRELAGEDLHLASYNQREHITHFHFIKDYD